MAVSEIAARSGNPELREQINAILVELHPEFSDAAAQLFPEAMKVRRMVRPEMPLERLVALMRSRYDWALAVDQAAPGARLLLGSVGRAPREPAGRARCRCRFRERDLRGRRRSRAGPRRCDLFLFLAFDGGRLPHAKARVRPHRPRASSWRSICPTPRSGGTSSTAAFSRWTASAFC
jgi:hypothetical protein